VTAGTPYLIDAAGRRFTLAGPVTTLGRSPQCDVFVPDRRASRRHAEVRWDGEQGTLHDLASDNGTHLNGCRITAPAELCDGDEIAIASAVFTFRDPEATMRCAERPALEVNAITGEVRVNRNLVALSPKEMALFQHLHARVGCACSKEDIATSVWPEYQTEVAGYQVESLIKRLREKLEPDPRHPVLILTARGQGYKLANS